MQLQLILAVCPLLLSMVVAAPMPVEAPTADVVAKRAPPHGKYNLVLSFAEDGTPILSKAQKRDAASTINEADSAYALVISFKSAGEDAAAKRDVNGIEKRTVDSTTPEPDASYTFAFSFASAGEEAAA